MVGAQSPFTFQRGPAMRETVLAASWAARVAYRIAISPPPRYELREGEQEAADDCCIVLTCSRLIFQ